MPQIISIYIPGNISPIERAERFVDPLQIILDREVLGDVFEEGTHLESVKGRPVIKGCQIDVEVKNLKRGLLAIGQALVAAHAPSGTSITIEGDVPKVLKLSEIPSRTAV